MKKLIYLKDAINEIARWIGYLDKDMIGRIQIGLERLPSAQSEQQWIPCTPDTLPEEAGEYLCTLVGVHNQGLPVECGYEPHNQKGMITGWSTCEADGFKLLRDEEVIAWMPLPEPYKEVTT